MPGRRSTSKIAAGTLALAAATTLVLAGGGSAAVLQDPAGDSGAAPDVTSLTVTNDARGRISFRLAFANRPNGLESTDAAFDLVTVSLNTDRNAATGDTSGADYLIQVAGDRLGVARWQGSRFAAVTASAQATRSGGTVAVTTSGRDLGRARAFQLSVASVRIVGGALQTGERAPDTGTWTYTLVAYCVAPDVKGMTLAAAKRTIRSANCGVGKVTHRVATRASGRVVRQAPKPGTVRPRGSKVDLVVARARKP